MGADLTTTATTDDYDTTFGPYQTGKMGDASVTASSWRLVERGRVVLFKKGQYAGKLAAIAQIIDHRRVLVEGFSSDASKVVPRRAALLRHPHRHCDPQGSARRWSHCPAEAVEQREGRGEVGQQQDRPDEREAHAQKAAQRL